MAAAEAEGASAAAVPGSGADGSGKSPGVEGEGGGAVGKEKDAAAKGAEAVGDSEDDGEDVFEVEKILDMKIDGGKIVYKVRWKGYTSDDDTWEPEVHLEDCKEVLLEFRKKVADNKAKPVKKDVQEKETKKNEPKEKYPKKHDLDKEEKGRKEPKALKTFKEIRNAFDLFKLTPEEKSDFPENNRKREEVPPDCKVTGDHRSKENKQLLKERRNTRDETDTWAYIAADGGQEVVDSTPQEDENSDGRQQILSFGMDLQLEWMKLEDFQKHLDGEDENFTTAEAIPSNVLRDAVKNGDYITVKFALNSSEEYNLDQEDSSGMTLVMLAAAGGQDDLLRLLLKKGAKVNGRQKNGTTALIHAAEKNFLTTVAILLEAGAFVNVQQSNGETALMKACKRGNSDIVRLVIECGADCNILSKHQNSALHFAKQCNNVLVYDLLKNHLETLSRVAEETIKDYFEARLALLEPVFPIACHRLCEGPDFSMDFNYRIPQNIPEGSGILLFIFHANFLGKEVIARLCGPCSVQAVILNDKFQLPVFLDSHFVYSFSPAAGLNKLFIRLTEAPSAKVKLLIGAYRVQLQ
ncbi:M-phase phosphoprotein 8 isoform X3 [Globicephala melas]|uniref:M-phase phosphoprotein 8 isoform X3 n=1 Tax=Globicephala melas TaxID=9731 RepID=UPI00293D4FFD|nr:M-phase phosphoprotein 8 isoform X3 [Globicephala melas]